MQGYREEIDGFSSLIFTFFLFFYPMIGYASTMLLKIPQHKMRSNIVFVREKAKK